ncbi:DUF4440 domain-containing protein [Seongchinamella sediminis]|uniref:DUF4440 domain-containing protein n=1 Tax=Seongchinamella sediminis TaxID=2283635 RepID=A0A3L7DS22_9GAMM|nr:DUF4440 domain-containing protein [Seongchinamella sediminis]
MQQLIDERAIYRQLMRFARAMDERDWDQLAQVTSEDFVADTGRGDIHGREACIAFMRSFLDHCGTTQHLLANVVIDVEADSATSSAYVCDMHLARDKSRGDSFRTLGIYHDQWQRVGDTWLMTRRKKYNRATLGTMDVFRPA